jgi:putative endonuclease
VKSYCVSILSSASGVLYTGVTNNLARRMEQHKLKLIPGFTKRYNVTRLVCYETFEDIRLAIAREKEIKSWSRAKRIALIESKNPEWTDLAATLHSMQLP